MKILFDSSWFLTETQNGCLEDKTWHCLVYCIWWWWYILESPKRWWHHCIFGLIWPAYLRLELCELETQALPLKILGQLFKCLQCRQNSGTLGSNWQITDYVKPKTQWRQLFADLTRYSLWLFAGPPAKFPLAASRLLPTCRLFAYKIS